MKIFTVIAVVCYLFVATNAFPAGPPPSDLVQKCSTDNNVSLEAAAKLIRHATQASNQNEKCLLSCYLKGKGYFVNGKIDFDKLLELHKNFVPAPQHDRLEKIFKDCEAKIVYGPDDCEVAYQVYKCAEGSQS